jgi:hypothetical protein
MTTPNDLRQGLPDPPITMAESDDERALAALRVPFPAEVIGLLPKTTQRDGQKSTCPDCGAFIGPHIHLDYVGHSAVTDRLLTNDIHWNWVPYSIDEWGLPVYRDSPNGNEVELWIKLTVRGVTRIGIGVVEKGKNDLGKMLISDALKNAAMRFGVALDLWTKDELESLQGEESTRRTKAPSSGGPRKASGTTKKAAPIPHDPATAGGVEFDSKARNKLIAHFSKMDPPVRGQEEVAKKIGSLLNLPEPLAASKLDHEQGTKLAELLGVQL